MADLARSQARQDGEKPSKKLGGKFPLSKRANLVPERFRASVSEKSERFSAAARRGSRENAATRYGGARPGFPRELSTALGEQQERRAANEEREKRR